eukprot:6158252-Prymnesium_polylepis.2
MSPKQYCASRLPLSAALRYHTPLQLRGLPEDRNAWVAVEQHGPQGLLRASNSLLGFAEKLGVDALVHQSVPCWRLLVRPGRRSSARASVRRNRACTSSSSRNGTVRCVRVP